MSTKISTIYDSLHTLVSTALSDHKELHIPDIIELNEDALLAKGWAIKISGATPVIRQIACSVYHVSRTAIITNTLTNYAAMADKTRRHESEKALLENQTKILKAVKNDCTLSGVVINLEYTGDNGIEYIYGDNDELDNVMIQSNFTFEYYEQ